MSKKILENENYMNDAFSCFYSNINLGIKRKEEMSIWGPVVMPAKSKSVFTKHKSYSTEISNNELVNKIEEKKPPSPKAKVSYCDSVENGSSIMSNVNNIENLEVTGNEMLHDTNNSNDESDEHFPETCLHNLQVLENKVNDTVSTRSAETITISSHHDETLSQNMDIEGRNSSYNCRLFSDEFDDEESCIGVKGHCIENMNSNHELETVSGRFRNVTKDTYENVGQVNLNKRQVYNTDSIAHISDEFRKWCENRRMEYAAISSPIQSDALVPIAVTTGVQKSPLKALFRGQSETNWSLPEIQTYTEVQKYPLIGKFASSKSENEFFVPNVKKMHESATSVENSDPVWKRRVYLKDDNCTLDRVVLNKINVSGSQMENTDIITKQVFINRNCDIKKESEDIKFDNLLCQKVSKTAHDIALNNHIFESNSQFPVVVSNDIEKTMDLKEHCDNTNPKIQMVEKVLDINTNKATSSDKNVDQKELRKSPDFITDINDKEEFNKKRRDCSSERNRNRFYEPPPRFINNKIEKRNSKPKKHSVPKVFSPKKSVNEDSKENCTKKGEKKDIHHSSECIIGSRSDHYLSVTKNTQLCVKITDEKSDKNFEFMADSVALSRIKKTLPDLSADIPDVDSGCKEIKYSADVMNIILRFVFCRSYKIAISSSIIGVEVLAAAQSWNMNDFFKFFQKNFFQNVLTSDNASTVFSYAYHYNLKEVCNKCTDISPGNTVTTTTAIKRRQKTCLISVSTYIEPLEISIPFEPTEADLSLSFPKEIHNKFTFKAISGYYSIIGFQIHLNEELVAKKVKNEENRNMLTIDYSIKFLKDNQEVEISERNEKPLRSLISIYFKENLVVKPNEIGEIFIDTEIEPYLCSAYKEKRVLVNNSVGELNLLMESNWKVQNSDRKLFLVGNFFYHVVEVPKI